MNSLVPEPDWDVLLPAVIAVSPGREGGHAFHRAIEALLEAPFHPGLT